jgi:hypothetical protein
LILPTTELQLPYVRSYSSAGSAAIGNAIAALSVTGTVIGGQYLEPFRVPEDYDRTREGRLYAFIGNGAATGPAAGNVELNTLMGEAAPAGVPTETTVYTIQAIPATWPASSWMQVEIGTKPDPFLPPATLAQLGLIGIRLSRNGPSANDTWTGTLLIAQFVVLRYHRLCLHCCHC